MESRKKSRIRQAMEIRGHGKLFETLEHHNERHYSAKDDVDCTHGKAKAELIDRGVNRKGEDLESRVDDVADDGIPSSMSDHLLVEEPHHNGHQLANDATLSPPLPMRLQTPKIRESGSALNPFKERSVSEVPYKPSTRRLQATTSQELVIRRPRPAVADQPSDQDQLSFSRQVANIDSHKNLIVETVHDDEQQSTLRVRIEETDQHGRQRLCLAQASSSRQFATTKFVNLRMKSEPIISLYSSPIVFKNPTKGPVLPQFNEHVLPSTQSAIYADSLSLANRQRAESSHESVNPMYILFSKLKYLSEKVDEFTRTPTPRVPLCSLLSLEQQFTNLAKMSVSFKILEPPDAEFCVSSELYFSFGPILNTHRAANSDEESKTETAFMTYASPPLRISLPTLRDLIVGDVWRIHNLNEVIKGDDWMSGSEFMARATQQTKRVDGVMRYLPIDWPQDGRPRWRVSHSTATCRRAITLPVSRYTNASCQLPAICSAAVTHVMCHGWSFAINENDKGDNNDDADGDGAPQPDATEISTRVFHDGKTTERMIDTANMTTHPDIHEIVQPTIIKTRAANDVGKKTKFVARFSTVGGEKTSPNSSRDPRGFSVKFYTEEGNQPPPRPGAASSNIADPATLYVKHAEMDGISRAIYDSTDYVHDLDATYGSPSSDVLSPARESRHSHLILNPIHINEVEDTNLKPAMPASTTHPVRKRLPHQGPCQPSPRPRRAQLPRTKFPRGRCHPHFTRGIQVPTTRSTHRKIHSKSKRVKAKKHPDNPLNTRRPSNHKHIPLPEDPAPFHTGPDKQSRVCDKSSCELSLTVQLESPPSLLSPPLLRDSSLEKDSRPYVPGASQKQAHCDYTPPKPSTPRKMATIASNEAGHIKQRHILKPTKGPHQGRHGHFKL